MVMMMLYSVSVHVLCCVMCIISYQLVFCAKVRDLSALSWNVILFNSQLRVSCVTATVERTYCSGSIL